MLKNTKVVTSILEFRLTRRSATEQRKAGSHAQLTGSESCRAPRRDISLRTKPISLLESPDTRAGFPLRILGAYAQLVAATPPVLDRRFLEAHKARGETITVGCGAEKPLAVHSQRLLVLQEGKSAIKLTHWRIRAMMRSCRGSMGR